MALRNYPFRLLLIVALISLLLLVLCSSLAIYLYRQQSLTADVLGENIGSRGAAGQLEETLNDLVVLHRQGVEAVAPLHQRIDAHLAEIDRFADKPEERELASQITDSFHRYRAEWEQAGSGHAAGNWLATMLRLHTIPLVRKLRDYNTRQIEESEQVHRRTLRWMSWGLLAVGGLGSLAGLLLGWGLARSLSQTIHQLRIKVQGASDLLSQELPAVVLAGESDFDPLDRQVRELVRQVEQVVGKLQQSEREVRRAERLAAVGQLAAGVAHEIRNPLTSIKMLVQTGREGGAGRLSDEDLGVIEQEIRRLERSLQTFLDFARPPRLERSRCDLVPLVERTLSLIRGRAGKQGVQLAFAHGDQPVTLDADCEHLHQVLVNLCLNSLDAMPHGGTLTIDLRRLSDQVEIQVRDTGPGVAADLMPRLFQPFVSSKETGLGLGLVVSRRIIEDHGGTLEASNLAEGGACFTIRLLAPEPAFV